jgi:hypothetical protein
VQDHDYIPLVGNKRDPRGEMPCWVELGAEAIAPQWTGHHRIATS